MIELLLKTQKPSDKPQKSKKSVKQMVQEYEQNIIPTSPEFRYDYKPVLKPETVKPIPTSEFGIIPLKKALKDAVQSYDKVKKPDLCNTTYY